MEISVPKYVKNVLKKLSSHNYIACIVGGCVRDIILGRIPNDWDIATSALPQQVLELFPNSLTMGLKHGTVTVKVGKNLVEVTTFRTDGEYSDHRHPENVSFVGDLITDLSRRDFTINAMAITYDGTIVDPFNGRKDIEGRLIRAVGEPKKRFEEDALRMFRAFRFSSRLDFEIENRTYDAIIENAQLATSLSAERIRDELEKVLMSDHVEYMFELISCGLLDKYLLKRMSRPDALFALSKTKKKTDIRWAVFCYILMCDDCIKSPVEFLKNLKLDGHTINNCSNACDILKGAPPEDIKAWKHMLLKYGVPSSECAACCMDAIYFDGHELFLKEILKSGDCFSVKHLDINGNDLASIGLKGKEIGQMLNFLLEYVIDFPQNNKKEILMSIASSQIEE